MNHDCRSDSLLYRPKLPAVETMPRELLHCILVDFIPKVEKSRVFIFKIIYNLALLMPHPITILLNAAFKVNIIFGIVVPLRKLSVALAKLIWVATFYAELTPIKC